MPAEANVEESQPRRSLLTRVFVVLAVYLVVTVGIFLLALWYGRNTFSYGQDSKHAASVSEGLGPLITVGLPLAAFAGFVALILAGLFRLAQAIWPTHLRSRRAEDTALKIGWAVVLFSIFALVVVGKANEWL